MTGVVWIIADALGASTWLAAGIAFAFGYTFRVIALYRAWEEPLAKEPEGVYLHDDGRPMLGRKIKGKSRRELRSLGLVVEHDDLQVDRKLTVPASAEGTISGHAYCSWASSGDRHVLGDVVENLERIHGARHVVLAGDGAQESAWNGWPAKRSPDESMPARSPFAPGQGSRGQTLGVARADALGISSSPNHPGDPRPTRPRS